jgi:hypothetical protein
MPATIVVEHGPDKGRRFELSDRAAEVRIGRGPGMTISMNDPAWQGAVRVSQRRAAYVVVNDTPGPIYLNGNPFPRGEERTWYHNERLQPTADTVLLLLIEAGSDSASGGGAVKETSSGTEATARRRRQQLLAAVLVPLAAGLWLIPSGPPGAPVRTTAGVRAEFYRVQGDLDQASRHPGHGAVPSRVLAELRQARLHEVAHRPGQAFASYARARDELEVALAPAAARELPEEVARPLRQARAFVSHRLLELGKQNLPLLPDY